MPVLSAAADYAPTWKIPAPRQGTSLSCRLDAAHAAPGPPITILHLAGELDISTRPMARTALGAGLHTAADPAASATGQMPGALVVDVADLNFCGAAGLTLFAETATAAAHSHAGYAFAGPNPHLQRITALLPPEDLFDVYPSIAVAVRALRRNAPAHTQARPHHADPHRALVAP